VLSKLVAIRHLWRQTFAQKRISNEKYTAFLSRNLTKSGDSKVFVVTIEANVAIVATERK
jgi:hypothetical protein